VSRPINSGSETGISVQANLIVILDGGRGEGDDLGTVLRTSVGLCSSRDLTFGCSLAILSSFWARKEFQRSSRAAASSTDTLEDISIKSRLDVGVSILDTRRSGRGLTILGDSEVEVSGGNGKTMPVTPAVVAGVMGEVIRREMGLLPDGRDPISMRLG
jgi:hypothetical protein